ncbi:hypothetical protein ABVT39_016350 [Epinephelus coioides]
MLHMQLNPNIPICNDPETCLKRDLRLTQQSVSLLLRIIHSLRDHGWGQELELLMFLYSLAHGLSLSVVCHVFGVPRSTVHRVIHRIAAEIKAKLGTLISLPSQDMLPDIGMGFCQLA